MPHGGPFPSSPSHNMIPAPIRSPSAHFCFGVMAVRSMLALPTPSETIEGLVAHACEGHNVTFTMDELSAPLNPGLAMWVLQLVALASALPAPCVKLHAREEEGRASKAQSGTASQVRGGI